jgi:hypothetical protein
VADDELDTSESAADEAALAVAARHALHDEELVAALATGSLDPADDAGDIQRAQSLVDRCASCRDLHRDIAAIGDAVRMDATGTIAAPRDFRLSVEDARRLGGPVPVGGFLVTLRRSIVSFGRPIGASMAALGIVGLLIGSVAFGGGAASSPISAGAEQGAPTNAPAGIRTDAGEEPKASDVAVLAGPASSKYEASFDTGTPREFDAVETGPSPSGWLLIGSIALLVGGLVLLVIAFGTDRGKRSRPQDS